MSPNPRYMAEEATAQISAENKTIAFMSENTTQQFGGFFGTGAEDRTIKFVGTEID